MLFALKYMDNLPEETFGTARDTSSAKAKLVLTPRRELNHPAQERIDTRAKGNLMLKERARVNPSMHARSEKHARRRKSCAI